MSVKEVCFVLGAWLRQDLLQADEITLELVALRSFAELEGERVLVVKNEAIQRYQEFLFTSYLTLAEEKHLI